ncbi:MAG TPA: M1 family aminopeptidase/hydrolase, partial [Lysobacter sp.]|nr:M1 family aminopeptidase/hydrolase [Lysobacter sp.]
MRHTILTLSIVLAMAAAAGCKRDAAPANEMAQAATEAASAAAARVIDEHSYAQPDKVKVKDLALELKVDFDRKVIDGSATLALDWLDKAATQLILDTRDLAITKVVGERSDGKWEDLKYALAPADKVLGSKLTIETPQRNARVRITYATSPNASGLQWLTAAMTEGKKTPFMFSQSQQIHARSWVPLQDTPSVRFTYTALVTAPKDAMVVMSAAIEPGIEGSGDTSGDKRDGDYSFRMPQPIPSYLLAIGAGDLVFKPISKRSGVWAEPTAVDKAVAEFADTEKMIETTEKLYGPYRWDRYDMLLLPPSFPYGGMENPRMTFLTPTVIVGDKSLVALIAHELAHSWSGNLVTFSTAKDAWLNEGFTSYVENRIIESMYGKERADMENVIERNELKQEFTDENKPLQTLAVKPGVLK